MIIECRKSKDFWNDVEKWIIYLGVVECEHRKNGIVLNKDRLISLFLLIAKVSIHTAKIKDKTPNFFTFKNVLGQLYKQARYLASFNNKEEIIESEWHTEWS